MRIDRRALHELLFGSLHRCCLCQKEEVLGPEGLCSACRKSLRLCSACRKSLRLCPAPASPFPLDGLTAGLLYEGEVPGAISRFKNREQLYLGGFFAQYMRLPSHWRGEVLVPVPLHPLKALSRGYNQSRELALYLSSAYGMPVCPALLKKTRLTRAQKGLSAEERQKNLENAFMAASEAAGRRIILVDDVCTTGATLCACAAALKKAGAARVYAAAAACVPYGEDASV